MTTNNTCYNVIAIWFFTPCKEKWSVTHASDLFFVSVAGLAVIWLLMTSPRLHPQRIGVRSRMSCRPLALPIWPTSSHWHQSRMSLPSARHTAPLSTCFVSTTKVKDHTILLKKFNTSAFFLLKLLSFTFLIWPCVLSSSMFGVCSRDWGWQHHLTVGAWVWNFLKNKGYWGVCSHEYPPIDF